MSHEKNEVSGIRGLSSFTSSLSFAGYSLRPEAQERDYLDALLERAAEWEHDQHDEPRDTVSLLDGTDWNI